MSTLIQILWKKTKRVKWKWKNSVALEKTPQKRGTILNVGTRTPRKPNSARWKIAKVQLSNNNKLFAYIPGISHTLQKHHYVLVSGWGAWDVPALNYWLIWGVLDFLGMPWSNKRSKFGAKVIRE